MVTSYKSEQRQRRLTKSGWATDPRRQGWQIKQEGYTEKWITGPWGLQITHRGAADCFHCALLQGISKQQSPSKPKLRATTLRHWRLGKFKQGLSCYQVLLSTRTSAMFHFRLSSNTGAPLSLTVPPNLLAAWLLLFPLCSHCRC